MGQVVPYHRIPMPEEAAREGIAPSFWRLLIDSIYPNAKTADGVMLALAYCKARNLDVLKRPVNIVPMWDSKSSKEVEQVWPSIGELQTTAARTGQWAGMDKAVFGPLVTKTFKGQKRHYPNKGSDRWEMVDVEVTVTFHETCEVTVYRLVGGVRCPFVQEVYWEEDYARAGNNSEIPTPIWIKRPKSQLMKVAKAASLRAAFPEECGTYAAEEMEGKIIDASDADLPRRQKGSSATSSTAPNRRVPDHNPETGEIFDAQADHPMVDHSAVSESVRGRVERVCNRAIDQNAWAAAASYIQDTFEGNDLAYAREELEKARFKGVGELTRQHTAELIARAAAANKWTAARAYLEQQPMSDLDREYARLQLNRAERAHHSTDAMRASA